MRKDVIISEDDADIKITLPASPKQFADFLGKLVGGKDKLRNTYKTRLRVTPDVLRGLQSALEERVTRQNSGSLVSTRYKIIVSDRREYITSDLDQLLRISPPANRRTVYLEISFVFLVVYSGQAAPSREQIDIVMQQGRTFRELADLAYHSPDTINVEIQYTERTWAEDLSSTIASVLDLEPEHKIKNSIAQNMYKYAEALFTFSLFVLTILYIISFMYFYPTLDTTSEAFNADGGEVTSEAIAQLIILTNPGFSALITFVVMGGGLLLSLLTIYIFSKAVIPPYDPLISFDLYAADAKHNRIVRKKVDGHWVRFLVGALLSIATSVIGAWVFELLLRPIIFG